MTNIFYSTIRISLLNNQRKYNGTTYYETKKPHLQRIHLLDEPQHNGIYEVEFTEAELKSSNTFCKGISQLIMRK